MNAIDSAWIVLKGSVDRWTTPYDGWGNRDRKHREQTKIAGGVPEDEGHGWWTNNDEPIPEDTSGMDDLASATREDLMGMLSEQVNQMSHEELIQLLVSTRGSLSTTFNTTGGA